ncbi:MAG: hypothetical protein WKG07_05920 [Hymenobacter sp.]
MPGYRSFRAVSMAPGDGAAGHAAAGGAGPGAHPAAARRRWPPALPSPWPLSRCTRPWPRRRGRRRALRP